MKTFTITKAKTGTEKIIGLIGKEKPYALLLETRFGIHTFGVKFPIDVVILDNNHVIKAMFEHMQPNRVFFWHPIYKLVMELPDETISKEKIKQGDKIKLVIK
jgi:hypothetical protein